MHWNGCISFRWLCWQFHRVACFKQHGAGYVMQNVPVHAFQLDICTVNLIGKGNCYPQCPGKFSVWNGWRWVACSGFCIVKSQSYSNLQNTSLSCWSPLQATWSPTNSWQTLSTEIKKSLHECCCSSCSQPDVLKMLQVYSQCCGILLWRNMFPERSLELKQSQEELLFLYM